MGRIHRRRHQPCHQGQPPLPGNYHGPWDPRGRVPRLRILPAGFLSLHAPLRCAPSRNQSPGKRRIKMATPHGPFLRTGLRSNLSTVLSPRAMCCSPPRDAPRSASKPKSRPCCGKHQLPGTDPPRTQRRTARDYPPRPPWPTVPRAPSRQHPSDLFQPTNCSDHRRRTRGPWHPD